MLKMTLAKAEAIDAEEIAKIESESFPEDEAASLDTIRYRLTNARDFFYKATNLNSNEIIGFVNGTCTVADVIQHDSMTNHEPDGRSLVIHSVTVRDVYRRNGVGTSILKEYVRIVAREGRVDRIFLLCKANLLKFYMSCGFNLIGPSAVVHGKNQWFDMVAEVTELLSYEQLQIDAFTENAFSGNPAAVVFNHGSEGWMQNIATENNLAETSFLDELPGVENGYYLRWFTPNNEVELCGHATLAAAHALYETNRVSLNQPILFSTRYSGDLFAHRTNTGTIQLNFPSTPPSAVKLTTEETQLVLHAFSISENDIVFTGRSLYDLLIEVPSTVFKKVGTPNFKCIQDLAGRGVILTCSGAATAPATENDGKASHPCHDRRFSFISRGFFPCYGINEDPVTGSAHCSLAPYWLDKLNAYGSKITGYQNSKRGGIVHVELSEDRTRVLLSGSCITIIKCKIVAADKSL